MISQYVVPSHIDITILKYLTVHSYRHKKTAHTNNSMAHRLVNIPMSKENFAKKHFN